VTLKTWINLKTTKVIAKELNVDVSAVRHWRLGRSLPRADQMVKIRKLSRGKVNYAEMIHFHLKCQKKKS